MMNRRRFLSISAAGLTWPTGGQAATWQGRAFGGDVSLTINAPRTLADAAISNAKRVIREVEHLFSLYDETSALSVLNRDGVLLDPAPQFIAILQAADDAHERTNGLFDPTIQPLWTALAHGRDIVQAQRAIGWRKVQFSNQEVRLERDQALTLNGIAQGFATDLVTETLTAGLTDILVNIGEYRGIGGPWKLGLHDTEHGRLGQQTIRTGAVASSSPAALNLGDKDHIMFPGKTAKWSTVSVHAKTATLADAMSTGLCLADRELINSAALAPDIYGITLIDLAGDLVTI